MLREKTFFLPLIFFLMTLVTSGQEKKVKADDYFFQYAYKRAIASYEKERDRGTYLSSGQLLNLADSYYKTGAFKKASEVYLEVYNEDLPMTSLHVNMMLQSLSATAQYDRVDSVLVSKKSMFSKELLENTAFNLSLLKQQGQTQELQYTIFNARANSPQSDFSPAFFEEKILFSSGRGEQSRKKRYAPTGEGYLKIYESDIQTGGQTGFTKLFSDIPASKYHKATPFYAEGLNTVFYVASNTEDGELVYNDKGKNALSIAKLTLGGAPQLLFRDLGTSFYYPFYEEKTGRLYFAADFEDGYGGTDIYYVSTNNGQIMSSPVNLGPRVNSPGNEISPYIFENSLYFASDVFYGLGGMDIYQSTIEERDTYSIPVNLGSEINSEADDFGMIIRNEGEGLLGYFASNRKGGKGGDDIYGFNVPEKPGLKTTTLKGKVAKTYDATDVVENAVVRLLDTDGNLIKETTSNENGEYRLEIPWRSDVVVQSTKNRYSTFVQKLEEADLEKLTGNTFDVNLSLYDDLVEEREGQKVVKLDDFFFGRAKTQLDATITPELDKVVEFVKNFPEAQLRIETYTDSRGGSSTNFRLTQARSDAIKKYLVDKGVPASNILYSVGYGEQKILNNCTNGVYCLEILHKRNQRSLIVVLNDNLLFN